MNGPMTPLARLVRDGTLEDREAYFDNTFEVYLENVLLPAEVLQEVCDFLDIDNPVFSTKGEITLHGPGGGISTLERMELASYLRRTLNL